MDETDCAALIKRLCAFFEHKLPTDATFQQWFAELKNIPTSALSRLEQEMKLLEAWPRNLPGKIWSIYAGFRAGRPGSHDCECINGQGFWDVAFWRAHLGQWEIFRIPCGCQVQGQPIQRQNMLTPKLYERSPHRRQAELPPWALVYPDQAGLNRVTQDFPRVATPASAIDAEVRRAVHGDM